MMKWGNKNASKSSSSSSVITNVFPTWLKKLKLKSGTGEPKTTKTQQKRELDGTSLGSFPANFKEGEFYGGIDDLYWRLSLGNEDVEKGISTRGPSSIWYDSDDEIEVPMSSCSSWRSRSRSADNQRFNDMVSEIRKMREVRYKEGIMQEKDLLKRTKAREAKFKAPKKQAVKDQESRTLNGKVLTEKKAETKRGFLKAEKGTLQSAEKDVINVEPRRKIQMKDDIQKSRGSNSRRQRSLSCPSYSLRTIKEDCVFESLELKEVDAFSEEEYNSEWKKLKDSKIKEIMSKSEQQRKSVYISRGNQIKGRKQNSRTKAFSPRTAAKSECKIKALEDMKKGKKTMRKKTKEKAVKQRTAFHSYAVVKSSFDPQQDFRDSMLEMIIEKGIKRPEELEELLVCYLTLNCDEYHDLIIKVFRQVWFELNQVNFDPE